LATVDDSKHLRVKVAVGEDEEIPSVLGIWPGADWHEREVWDMMGIRFSGHPNLKRILMWEGYPFFPLRKDFPLAGRPSDMPDVAFTGVAPLEGGPFVTCAGGEDPVDREPRARAFD
jgi:NADH-quinone oxidoreductase subunit C